MRLCLACGADVGSHPRRKYCPRIECQRVRRKWYTQTYRRNKKIYKNTLDI